LKWARKHATAARGRSWRIGAGIDGWGRITARDCCYLAALAGHLEVLEWLPKHDGPWDKMTVSGPLRADVFRC